MSYQLISDYKDNSIYRESFNSLAESTFEINLEEWYQQGFWNDKYICYSYVDKGKVIANVSINKMDLTYQGENYRALQIGTVMTHPDYRNQGLAQKLINHVISKYEAEYDFFYLFANDSVVEFYPKFGFERVEESSFTVDATSLKKQPSQIKKLNPASKSDFQLISRIVSNRASLSTVLDVRNSEDLLMFYVLIALKSAVYYLEELDTIVLFEQEETDLYVLDIISTKKVNVVEVLQRLVTKEIDTIHLSFTPEKDKHIDAAYIIETEDILFMRPNVFTEERYFQFPATSHA
ncbi:GNAT family N-acetyltransferase [Listeria ivanovii]|uniref:N-acetyltransferase domain-containing protein n=1 Tax=Listeria ivanovii (strain ATCC BAA-678 / PAM 55) TaxID=881621 RepID=G2ZEF6_LISIP|nr:GNAT family N-acetyltransferase [Listeria ivanovii]AHI56769.1 GNAT family acetyltransferase [Listeria ivanovii WSLC3009]AIS66186.1 GNAT family acetyltransferase [Listeria ivanovii subsp. ivanovii]MBC1760425.1 GNAT family N-acetyltransferase [Listeria ivanovii]MBK3913794.1 GNAT family N-acetyltransferase [Listeria ivanovii subsp. ivanovii]MBK3921368.1 GNAT family N-acetyltransferase [Listeria ivanovii subsp. ivanovii]